MRNEKFRLQVKPERIKKVRECNALKDTSYMSSKIPSCY